MPWTQPSNPNAVSLLYDGGDVSYLSRVTGSTCTVNLSDDSIIDDDDDIDSNPFEANRLRMYGVTHWDVESSIFFSTNDWSDSQEDNPGTVLPCPEHVDEIAGELNIGFIRSRVSVLSLPNVPLFGGVPSDVGTTFSLRSPSSTARPPVKTTCIPPHKWSQSWFQQRLWYSHAAGGAAMISPTIPSDASEYEVANANELKDFDVWYKDPSVIRLPEGNGWIMFLARYRVSGYDSGTTSLGPQDSIGDIVAYWAPDDLPGFDDETRVKGPFLFVPSFLAPYGDVQFLKVWLGVPGAVVVNDHIYLYFVAEKQNYGLLLPDGTPTSDGTIAMEVEAAIAFKAGTFVWRYSWRAVVNWIQTADVVTMCCEKNWEEGQGNWVNFIAPLSLGGDTLGPVRVWMQDEFANLQPFSAPYRGGSEVFESTRIVDPAPARTTDTDMTESFILSFAVINGVNADGGGQEWSTNHVAYGVWRAASCPTDLGRDWIFGVDFVVGGPFTTDGVVTTFVDTDQIVRNIITNPSSQSTGNIVYTDPDPVRLLDGSWIVFVGQPWPAPILQFTANQSLAERDWIATLSP